MKKVSILVPCYNEEDSIPLFHDELSKVINSLFDYEWDILFVNDGSKDNTLSIIKSLRKTDNRINYLDLSRNFGKEKAMLAGFDFVKGDCMIIMDADLQDPPEMIKKMLEEWENGYDDVYAKRMSRKGESYIKKITSKLFYRILQKVSTVEIQEDTGDFRLLDRICIEALKKIRETQRYTKGLFSWIGYNKKEILFERHPRVAGKTKWNYGKLFGLASEGITSFTVLPLKLASYLGILISLSAFVYMIIKLVKALLYGDAVKGYPSMIIIILFLGGIQILFLGILGDYIGKIYNETKNRPTYIAKDYNGEKIY